MKHHPEHKGSERKTIFTPPNSSDNTTIYLGQRRAEELDPVEISVPDEENIDPKKIEPIGNYGNNESPSNVEGVDDEQEPDDDEDTTQPLTPHK